MKKTAWKDRYLDGLILLAMSQLEEEKEKEIGVFYSADPALSANDALRADRVFQEAMNRFYPKVNKGNAIPTDLPQRGETR